MFSCEFCQIFKNTFFIEHLWIIWFWKLDYFRTFFHQGYVWVNTVENRKKFPLGISFPLRTSVVIMWADICIMLLFVIEIYDWKFHFLCSEMQ